MKVLAVAMAVLILACPAVAGADPRGRYDEGGGRGGEHYDRGGGGRWAEHGFAPQEHLGPGPEGPSSFESRFPGRPRFPGQPRFSGAQRFPGPFAVPGFASPYRAPAYPPARRGHPSRYGWSRGQYMPPGARGEVVQDYGRYHLRRPPPGYYWYRNGDDFVLAAVASGLIFEVITGY